MIHSYYNKKTNILETHFEGEIGIEEMFEYIVSVRENISLPQKLKIYSYASIAKFDENVNRKDLVRFLNENKITLDQKEFIYDAFVVSGAFEMALGMLYRELNKIKNYKFEVFSTKEAAINWLQGF
jgi:hypothetical protein